MTAPQKTILVIDDEEAIVLLLETILGVYNFKSKSCKDPEKAVETVLEVKPDLVVLDIAMPGKDGYEICTELKKNSETRSIPILMITALSLSQDKKLSIESGADGFIAKPFEPDMVIKEIDKLLGVSAL